MQKTCLNPKTSVIFEHNNCAPKSIICLPGEDKCVVENDADAIKYQDKFLLKIAACEIM